MTGKGNMTDKTVVLGRAGYKIRTAVLISNVFSVCSRGGTAVLCRLYKT